MDMVEKKKAVMTSFNKFYERIKYLDQEIGKSEQEYIIAPPYVEGKNENGIITIDIVHDKPLKDTQIYIKLPGIILEYVYGALFCEKHKRTYLYIYKDKDYIGDAPAKIADALTRLEEFLDNNKKMIYDKIGKKFGDAYRNDTYEVKYRKIDFFDKEYIKAISIRNLNITMEDIYKLATFKSVDSLDTFNCNYKDKVYLKLLPNGVFSDCNSKMQSFDAFDHANFKYVSLDGTTFSKEPNKCIKLNCESLRMIDIDMIYSSFFINTDFHNIQSLVISKDKGQYFLSQYEAQLLSCFYNVKNMDLNAYVDNFDFLFKLQYLESFNGSLKVVDERKLDYIRKLRYNNIKKYANQEPKFDIKRYLEYQRMLLELDRHKIGRKIRIPRIAETKWRAIIEDAIMLNNIDDVRNKLLAISKMSISEREKIGSEEEIVFINTNIKNSYQELGIKLFLDDEKDLIHDARHISNIVGQYGNKLYKELLFRDGYRLPIVGPNGRQIAVLDYDKEHYEELPEYTTRYIKENFAKNNSIFDAYYNSPDSTEDKMDFLEDKLCSFMFLNEQKKITYDIRKRAIQKKVKDIIENRMSKIRWHNFGILNCFIGSDKSVADILLEERTIDSIKEYFDREAKENRWDKEDISLHEKELLEYIELDDKEKRLTNIKPFVSILKEYIQNDGNLKTILSTINEDTVESMFLPDIDKFINQFQLNESQKKFAKNYMLYLQENKKHIQEDYLSNLYREEEALTCDGYHMVLSWYNMSEDEDRTLEQLYNDGIIDYKNYINASRYEQVCSEIARIRNTPTPADLSRIEKYYDLINTIDGLSISDLSKIKETILIANEYITKFDKFCDYLIYLITDNYPEWILLELAKRPKIQKELKDIVHTTYSPETKIHVKKFSKLSTNPFDF